MRVSTNVLLKRGTGFVPLLFLGVWLLAVLLAGLDMTLVWIDQLHGGGDPGVVYIAMSQRLGLLAFMGGLPPLLAWGLWRIATRLARHARSPGIAA